jgi:hypothetical protein
LDFKQPQIGRDEETEKKQERIAANLNKTLPQSMGVA